MDTYDQELDHIKAILSGSSEGLTVTEIARQIKINRNSVAKYLDILLTSGEVEMKAVGSAKIYSLTKRIPVNSILSHSSDYIIILDNDAKITYVTDNVLNFEGKTNDEILGKSVDTVPLSLFTVPDMQNLIREGIKGKDLRQEFSIRKGEASYCFRAKLVPSLLKNRKKGLLLFFEDITEIKKYQKQLEKTVVEQGKELTTSYQKLTSVQEKSKEVKGAYEESERRYHNLIELAQEGVLTVDPEGIVTFTNRKFCEILGYPAEEIRGRPIYSFTNERDATLLKKDVSRLKTGRPQCFTITFIKSDGSPVYTRVTGSSSLDENGKYSYGLFLISDISELKKADEAVHKSELHFRTLIETMPNGVISISSDGRIRSANIRAVKMLGYATIEEAIGKNLFDYIAPTDLEKCTTSLKRVNEKDAHKATECTLISLDSTAFCVEMNVSRIRNEISPSPAKQHDPGSAEYVCILSDITERRKAEYRVRKSEEKHRALVEGISNIIFTTDTKGKLTYVSPVINQILGYDPAELSGKHFYRLAPPYERHKIGLMIKKALAEKTGPEEFTIVDKTGGLHDVRIIAQPYWEKDTLAGINGLIEDITELKKAENLLRKIELQYKAVVEHQVDLICRILPDFSITFVNPAFLRYYQKTEPEAVGKNLFAILDRNLEAKMREITGKLTPDRPVEIIEHECISVKGICHAFHTTIRAIFNPDGEANEFQLSSRDITELQEYYKKSQDLLEELQTHQKELEIRNEELVRLRQLAERSEREYLDLYDSAPAGYFTLAPNGKILRTNLTGAALLGRKREEIINSSLQEYIPPENRDRFIGFCKRIFESSGKQKCEIPLIRAGSGDQIVIQADGKRIEHEPDQGKRCRIIMTDITDRVMAEKTVAESENRLKKMVEGSPVPIFVIDRNHKGLYWNKAMSACTGVNAASVIGTTEYWKGFYNTKCPCLADLVVDGVQEEALQQLPYTVTKSRLVEGAYEAVDFFPSMGENGKWLHITASPLYDTHGEIIAALETIVDITDMKLAEETIKKANVKISTLNAITRHDIINQLTVIQSFVEFLELSLPERDALKKHTDRIKTATQKIQDLIVFTRDYQNVGVEKATWYSLHDLMKKALDRTDATALDVHIDPAPISIYGDPLIERVFANLVDNSIRHGERVSAISVSLSRSDHKGTIIFEDNGTGIPAGLKKKIFSKGAGKTAGFGLFISSEILGYHGMSIRETGVPGKGARFEIDIPITHIKIQENKIRNTTG